MLKSIRFTLVVALILSISGCWSAPLRSEIALRDGGESIFVATAVCPGSRIIFARMKTPDGKVFQGRRTEVGPTYVVYEFNIRVDPGPGEQFPFELGLLSADGAESSDGFGITEQVTDQLGSSWSSRGVPVELSDLKARQCSTGSPQRTEVPNTQ